MKKLKNIIPAVFAVVLIWLGCKEKYTPPETSTNNSYLVVEGNIAGGADSTIIKLSRTVKINATTNVAEQYAKVTVEDDQNNSYPLKETLIKGTYGIPAIGLVDSRKYRLRIAAINGEQYLSDYVAVKNAPPIDSVGYKITDDGISIYANTHDATNKTRYYRWDYEEAWKFHTTYFSVWKTDGKKIVPLPVSEYKFYCFGSHNSNTIIVNSSNKLTQDVLYQAPVLGIPKGEEKLQMRYSILLKQYALTDDAYKFWDLLKTNSQNLGSIFDAQPSQSIGNIHCTSNPAAVAIGFISAGAVQRKRIFIDRAELPAGWATVDPYKCKADTMLFCRVVLGVGCINEVAANLIPIDALVFPVDEARTDAGVLNGYLASSRPCIDCTTRGKLAQPAFWKEK
jgi:hypothetical protein